MPSFAPTTENLNQLYRDNHDTAMVWKFYTGNLLSPERYAIIDWRKAELYIVNPDWSLKKQKLIVKPEAYEKFWVRWGINRVLYPMTQERWNFIISEQQEARVHLHNLYYLVHNLRAKEDNMIDWNPDTNEIYQWPIPEGYLNDYATADDTDTEEEDEDVSITTSQASEDEGSTDPEVV